MYPHSSIVGQSQEGAYSQAYVVENFIILLSLSGDPGEVNLELGHNTIAKIEQIVDQTPSITPKEITEMTREQFQNGIKLSFLAAKIEGQKLSLSGFGAVAAKIIRKGKIISLIGAGVSNIAGPILDKDLLILGSEEFFNQTDLLTILSLGNVSPEEIKEAVLPGIESIENGGNLAAIFVKAEAGDRKEEVVQPPLAEKVYEPGIPIKTEPYQKKPSFSLDFILKKFRMPEKKIFLGEAPEDRRKFLYLILLVVVIFASVITYQLRSRTLEVRDQKVAEIRKIADDGINSADKLAGLNDQIARETLATTETEVRSKIAENFGKDWQKNRSAAVKKLEEILQKLDQETAKIAHVYKITKLDDFYDFSLLKAAINVVSASLHGGEMTVLDQNNGAVYNLTVGSKAATILSGNDSLKSGKFIDSTADNGYVWTSAGIFQVSKAGGSGEKLKQIINSADKWGEIRGLATFGGNLYLLDAKNNQIWKYQGTSFGFADIGNYLQAGLTLDFSRGTAIIIDGYIYITTSDGNIARFASGAPYELKITGLDVPFKENVKFFANDEAQNLYVLDPGNHRVVVLDKKGVYRAQYQITTPNEGRQLSGSIILADEGMKKIFLVSGAKVSSIDLR